MSDFDDYIRRQQFVDQIKAAQVVAKRNLREALSDEVEAFVANGGKVTEIPSNPPVPRQPCKNPQPYPKRPSPKPFYHHKYNKLLREWLAEVEGRGRRLAAESGYAEPWISARRQGFNQLLLVDWEILHPAMMRIENNQEHKQDN